MIVVQLIGSLLSLLGLLAIFLTWRRRGVRAGLWRWGLPGGWALLCLGLAVWMVSTNPDQGLALGSVMAMVLACAILAWQGLKLTGQPAKAQIERESATDTIALGKGYWGRVMVRLIGCLVVTPAFGALLGLLWLAYVPGDEADRLMGLAFVAMLAMTAGLVIQLASRRPYRAFGGLTAVSVIAAALVFLPGLF